MRLENEDLARAFALRNRATEMQRQRIEALYYLEVTGEVYKAIDALRHGRAWKPASFRHTTCSDCHPHPPASQSRVREVGIARRDARAV